MRSQQHVQMSECLSATELCQQGAKIAASICINSVLAKQLNIYNWDSTDLLTRTCVIKDH